MERRAGKRMAVGKLSTARLIAAIPLPIGRHQAVWFVLCLLLLAVAAVPAPAQERAPAEITAIELPAQPFTAGVEAFDRSEFAKAREIWLPWAHQGDPAAQRNLAHLYRMGLGVPQNFVQASAWYRLAADGGLARAQANLAAMYLRGQGVEEDALQAAFWFTTAAVQGHALAQFNLALLYLRGEGVERNEAKAAGWLYRAAQDGYKPAMRTLGKLVPAISGPAGPPARLPAQVKLAAAASPPLAPVAAAPANPAPAKTVAPETATAAPVKVKSVSAETKVAPPVAAGSGNRQVVTEGWSLVDALADMFVVEPEPAVNRAPQVTYDDNREELARRNITAGLVALHAANVTAAKALWQPLAEDGHAEAQYLLGKLYLHNNFPQASRPWGYYWLSRAAAQQHDDALAGKSVLDDVMNREERVAARQLVQSVVQDNATGP